MLAKEIEQLQAKINIIIYLKQILLINRMKMKIKELEN